MNSDLKKSLDRMTRAVKRCIPDRTRLERRLCMMERDIKALSEKYLCIHTDDVVECPTVKPVFEKMTYESSECTEFVNNDCTMYQSSEQVECSETTISTPTRLPVFEKINYETKSEEQNMEYIDTSELQEFADYMWCEQFDDQLIGAKKTSLQSKKDKVKFEQKKNKLQQISRNINARQGSFKSSVANNRIIISGELDIKREVQRDVTGQFTYWQKRELIFNVIDQARKQVQRNPQLMQLARTNNLKVTFNNDGVKQANQISLNYTNFNQWKEMVLEQIDQLLYTPDFYKLKASSKRSVGLMASNGNFRGSKLSQNLDKYLHFNPITKTRCVFQSIAVCLLSEMSVEEYPVNKYVFIMEQSKQISKKYGITNGCELEQFVQIAKDFNIPIYNFDTENSNIQKAGLVLLKNHCTCILPINEKNEILCQELQQFNYKYTVENKVMKKWEPKQRDRKYLYVAYDFEWITVKSDDFDKINEQGLNENSLVQITYACSIKVQNQPSTYIKGLNCQRKVVELMYDICKQNSDNDIIFIAHNGQKADYPFLHPHLLDLFEKSNMDYSSKMNTVSYNWNLCDQQVMFQDSMNLMQMSLEELGKMYCVNSRKLDCDHSAININNWESEWDRQNIQEYVCNDVEVLMESILKLTELIKQETNIDIMENNIMTTSSLTQKDFFQNAYNQEKTPIYSLPDYMFEAIHRAYQGGNCQVFMRGYYKNIKLFAIDINSSYPGQMANFEFPIGPFYIQEFFNQEYKGQQLVHGMYDCVITCTYNDQIPFIMETVDGRNQSCIPHNLHKTITKPEIEYAYSKGYKIIIKKGYLSKKSCMVFKDYINNLYTKRCDVKKQMKTALKNNDMQLFNQLNALQLNVKLRMNSLYGKFGQAKKSQSFEMLSNEELVSQMIDNGQINKIEEYQNQEGKTFYQLDVVQEKDGHYSNPMIASYVTALGRIQLNKIQVDTSRIGFDVMYGDTDSVYFKIDESVPNKTVNEMMEKLSDIHCDPVKLGKCKYETGDDIGNSSKIYNQNKPDDDKINYDFANECVFLTTKTYALKSSQTGRIMLKGAGINQYILQDNNPANIQKNVNNTKRTLNEGNNRKITFNDYVKCVTENKPLKPVTQQFAVEKKNLFSKKGQVMTKELNATYEHKFIGSSGKCYPKKITGEQVEEHSKLFKQDEDYIEFPTLDDITKHFELKDNKETRDRIQIIRNSNTNQFFAFQNYENLIEFFNKRIKNNPEKIYHLLFGSNIQLCFDIDCSGANQIQQWQDLEITPQYIVQDVQKTFGIDTDIPYEIIDRCREGKKSFHIRFDYSINKDVLLFMIKKIKKPWILFLDTQIYNNSLRMTQISEQFVHNHLNQNAHPDNFTSKDQKKLELEIRRNKQRTQQQTLAIDKQYYNILQDLQIQEIFKIRQVKQYGKKTIINLYRQKESFCKDCQRDHTNDNNAFIEVSYNNKDKKKQIVELKCYKYLQAKKKQ